MGSKGFWDNDFETVGELIEHLRQFDERTRVYVSTQAGGGITAALRATDDNEPVVCFYGKNGGGVFNPPLTEDYYREQRDKLLNYLSDSKYRCETKYHGGRYVIYKIESSIGTYKYDEINKIVVDKMKSDGLLPERADFLPW